MKTIKVTYSNGDVVLNDMAAHLTDEQMLAYYAVGRQFNLGAGDKDNMQTVIASEVVESYSKDISRLIATAKNYLHDGCSSAYTESRMWASRDTETSLSDIAKAIAMASE